MAKLGSSRRFTGITSLAVGSTANILACLALIVLMGLVGLLIWESSTSTRDSRGWVRHTYEVLASLDGLGVAIRDAETGQRGFLLTGDESYLAPYRSAVPRIALVEGDLQRLTADNPAQQQRLKALAEVVQRKLEELARTVEVRRSQSPDAALGVVRTQLGQQLTANIEVRLAEMQEEERRLLADRVARAESESGVVLWLTLSGIAIAIASLVMAVLLLHRAGIRLQSTAEARRAYADRLATSLNSLSQGVGVFDAELQLTNWNECFQILLDLPKAMVREGTPYAALAEHTAQGGIPFLETEDQIAHTAPADWRRPRSCTTASGGSMAACWRFGAPRCRMAAL